VEDGGVITRILILIGLCIAASTARALDVVDVGAYVPEPYPGRSTVSWLDDERLVFAGYLTAEELPPRLKQFTSRLFEYNITTGKLIDKGVIGVSVCYDNGYVRYSRPMADQKLEGSFPSMQPYYGRYGEEQPLPSRRQAVPSDTQLLWNCLYDSELPTMPTWIVEAKKQGRIFRRLRPEHGWVEVTKPPPDERAKYNAAFQTYPLALHVAEGNANTAIPLPDKFKVLMNINTSINPVMTYAMFKEAYVVRTLPNILPFRVGDTATFWWLYPDGRVEDALMYQRGVAWPHADPRMIELTRAGPILFGEDPTAEGVRYIGKAGIYRIASNMQLKSLVKGRIANWALSPDGCKLAFGNDDRPIVEGTKQYKLQIIDVCTER
jgi:hypothetical protein